MMGKHKQKQQSEVFELGKFSAEEAEKLRFLRTNFLSVVKKAKPDPRIIVLCAADCKADELARSVLSLSCALTALDKKVLVIDIDRKNARVHELMGGVSQAGHIMTIWQGVRPLMSWARKRT